MLPKRSASETLRIELAMYALAKKLERLFKTAERSGIAVVVDADATALRLIPAAVVASGVDLRGLGNTVKAHGGCGGGSARVSGDAAANYGVR